jgi:hypothetical protein
MPSRRSTHPPAEAERIRRAARRQAARRKLANRAERDRASTDAIGAYSGGEWEISWRSAGSDGAMGGERGGTGTGNSSSDKGDR